MPEPVNGSGMRPRPAPPLVRAMYFSENWPAALMALSPADRVKDCLVNSVGWDVVQSAMNCSAWVHVIFGRFEPGDNPFPTQASMRAGRAFEGALRVAPLAYLEDVALPGDWPSGFTTSEQQSGLQVIAGSPIEVGLPVSGPPVIARKFMPMLAVARANDLYEVAVKVRYL